MPPAMPALLKITSSLPKTSTARATAASTSAKTETSTPTAATLPSKPSLAISCAAACACAWLMSAIMTFAPSRTNFRTVARPMPLAPPVMSATFPSRRMGIPLLRVYGFADPVIVGSAEVNGAGADAGAPAPAGTAVER
ncbi:hypothetical protein MIC448_1100031 [Microbacterium sp. C448]|nr:hypothetical protein MIC448_1100031 [Microbacterium sp. C448]